MFQSRKPTLFNRTVLGCAVFSASMGLASQVHAQKQLEEVVVTAQKRAQSANDVGITINAFTGQQIRDFGVFTAEDIAMRTPGLTVNETAATGGTPVHHSRRGLPGLFHRGLFDGGYLLR